MKKNIKFTIKKIIFIIFFIFILFFSTRIYKYMDSNTNNTYIANTASQFETITNKVLDYTFSNNDNDSKNINFDNIENVTVENNNSSSNTIIYTNTKYYYNQLDNNAKTIYNSLENNIEHLKDENYIIDLSDTFDTLLHKTTGEYTLNKAFQSSLDAFFYDHPELFYVDLTKISLNITCTSIGPIKKYTVKISPANNKNYLNDYFTNKNNVESAIQEIEKIKNNFVNEFKNYSDYNKILEVHNALANSLEYDTTLKKSNIHNIYGALVNRRAVCEGYAKAFKYLLNALNIECILISGTASDSSGNTESHMWNYVKTSDGMWYGVDVTWDDPIIIGGSSKNNIRYDYFLKGNKTFIESHSPSGKISDTGILFKIPTLSNTNYK